VKPVKLWRTLSLPAACAPAVPATSINT